MPFVAAAPHRRAVELAEWVTPSGVELMVAGDLDAMACRAVEQQLRRLVARWPGLLLTLDLDRVGHVDESAAETLVFAVVAMRAGEARLGFAAKGGACRSLLAKMGVAALPPSGTVVRWLGDAWGTGHLLAGVTA